MSTLQAAARFEDPIGHPPLWASVCKAFSGLVVGAVVGAVVGTLARAAVMGVVALAGAGTVASGGILGPVLVTGAVLVISALVMNTDFVKDIEQGAVNLVNDAIDAIAPPKICGFIQPGSPNVFINDKPATRAIPEPPPDSGMEDLGHPVQCNKHTPPLQCTAEGSKTVYINDFPAHRVKDHSSCNAVTMEGSPNVFIGGEQEQVREITSEVPTWVVTLGEWIGVALAVCKGRWRDVPGKVACLAGNMLAGMAVNSAVSSLYGNPVHAASGAKILDGSDDMDFALPARLPLEWVRRYNSMDRRNGLLGSGWSTPVSVQLKLNQPGEYPNLYIDPMGREIPFEALEPGESMYNGAEGYRLGRTMGGHYAVEVDDGLYHEFGPAQSDGVHTLDLLSIEDRNGNALLLHRDEDGRLTGLSDSAGRFYRCHYDSVHPQRLAAIELVYGETEDGAEPDYLVRYAYDGCGRLITVTDRAGIETRRFSWHDSGPGAGLIASHTLPDGLNAHYRWETFADHPRVVEQWDDQGSRWHAEYDLAAGTTKVTDQLGRTQHWRWNERYAVTEYSNAANESWRMEWNVTGMISAVIQPNGGVWRFDYDERGNLIRQTDPNGAVSSTEWLFDRALPKRDTDALGNTVEYRYDALGNLVETVDVTGATSWTLDHFGQPLLRTAPGGTQTCWNWNESGLIVNTTDCTGQVTHYDYDRDGNLTALTDALGQRSEYQYDSLGRATEARLPDETTRQWQWTASSRLAAAIDAAGRPTAYYWDAKGQLTRRTDAASRPVDYQYDAPGNLTAVINENGEAYRFEHDAADRVVAQIALDGKRTELTLDRLGLPIEVREAAGTSAELVTLLGRDLLGQLVTKTTTETVTTYSRNALGLLTKIERSSIHGTPLDSIEFGYDTAGNLVSETQQILRDGKTYRHALAHAYDALGNRLSTTLPDGRVINALYYGSGHLHQLNIDGRVVCDFERDALHREVSRTQGRLHHHTRYDPLSRKLAQTSRPEMDNFADPKNGLDKRYQYDVNGELIRRADTLFGQIEHRYDETGRILATETQKTGKAGRFDELFFYDAAANLVMPEQTADRPRGFVRHNRITVFEDKRYRYDEHGRLIEKKTGSHTTVSLKWNAEHQLIETRTEKHNVTQRCRYEYDAIGRRTAKHDDFGTTAFVWDGMRLIQERRRHHTLTYLYQPDGYEPIARIDDRDEGFRQQDEQAKIYHFHNHVNGAPEELTDEAGNIVWQGRYATWGNLALQTAEPKFLPGRHADADPQALRMQGQYEDAETGLYYNTFRYYDPDIGRFITEDPIGLNGGLNLYQFAPNANSWIDPWGWAKNSTTNNASLGSENNPYPTSRAARREAMRQAGIPTSQQPTSQSRNNSGREYRYDVPKPGGGTAGASVQQQTMDSSHPDKPHWEAGRVKVDDDGNTRMNRHGRPQLRSGKGKAFYRPPSSRGCIK